MSLRRLSHRGKLLLCFAIVYLAWGASFLATSIGVRALPPLLFGGCRCFAAGLLLLLIARFNGQRLVLSAPVLRNVSVVATGAILMSTGANVWSIQWLPSHQVALLNASSSLWIALFGVFGARGHPLSNRVLFGLAVGFAGTALIMLPRGDSGTAHAGLWQEGIVLLGCMAWAAATIFVRNSPSKLDVLSFTGLQMLIGGLMLTVAGLLAHELPRFHLSVQGLLAMLYLMLFSSCLGYTAFGWLTRNTTPARLGTYGYVNPMIATVLGWLVLGERLSALQLSGMAIILLGVALVSWPATAQSPTGNA